MKILVSGSSGFIGSHLVKRLLQEKHDLCVIARPSTKIKQKINTFVYRDSPGKLNPFLEKEKFDGVIHLASLFLAQHKTEDIKGLVDSNILFGTILLEAAVKNNISWFINTGTFWQHYQNKNYAPVNLYAATKQAFENIAKYYIETSQINFVTIKLNDTFGPGDTRPKIFTLWKKISETGQQLDMSKGEQIIDISFIDNVIDGYIQLIRLVSSDKNRKLSGKSFAISSNERMTLRKLAKTYEQATKKKLNINWGKRPYRPREVMIPWSKGKKIPGWRQNATLKEGIKNIQ